MGAELNEGSSLVLKLPMFSNVISFEKTVHAQGSGRAEEFIFSTLSMPAFVFFLRDADASHINAQG